MRPERERSLQGLRIVQAVGWYMPGRIGGTEIYVDRLARELTSRSAIVEIVAPEPGAVGPRSYAHNGIPVHRYPTARDLSRDEAQTRVPVRGSEWLRGWLADTRPDVVHFHTFVPGMEISEVAAAHEAGARVIVTSHASSLAYLCARGTLMYRGQDVCDGHVESVRCAACLLEERGLTAALSRVASSAPVHVSAVLGQWPGPAGTALGARSFIEHRLVLQSRLFTLVHALVVLTEWARQIVLLNGGPADRVVVNRLGIAGEGYVRKPSVRERPTKRPVRVGYLGRFDPIKGVDDLLAVLSDLPANVPIELEIRGPLPEGDNAFLLEEAQRLAARDSRIHVGAALAPDDVPAFLSSLDVLCCPSRCLEGGPTVAIEAHAVGTPVVGTRIGGLAELVDDGRSGALIPPGDRAALRELLITLANDPAGTVDRWREQLPLARTMTAIVDDYVPLYCS